MIIIFRFLFILFLLIQIFCKNENIEEKKITIEEVYFLNLENSKKQNKKILIIFGANWCVDCRALDNVMNQPESIELLNQNFIIQKVDVGDFNKNLSFGKKFNRDIEELGIPNIVVIDKNEKILNTKIETELYSAKKINLGNWKEFLLKYSKI